MNRLTTSINDKDVDLHKIQVDLDKFDELQFKNEDYWIYYAVGTAITLTIILLIIIWYKCSFKKRSPIIIQTIAPTEKPNVTHPPPPPLMIAQATKRQVQDETLALTEVIHDRKTTPIKTPWPTVVE